jgi:hypothetical protein
MKFTKPKTLKIVVLSGFIMVLIGFLTAPTIVMNNFPGSFPSEYDLYFPGCLSHSLQNYMIPVESSLAYQLFLWQHRDMYLSHFQMVSYNDSTVSPVILLIYVTSDGFSIAFTTRPFSHDFIVNVGKVATTGLEQLSRRDIQEKIQKISLIEFESLFQTLIENYHDFIRNELKVLVEIPKLDGTSVGLSVNYDNGEIRFHVSTFSRIYGRLFTADLDPSGNILHFTISHP